jgi:uncharacterized damage-inducible protein DinB
MDVRHYRMFAAYNRWANATLYGACAALTQIEFARNVGAYFGSMRGTLNHLVVADRIWMRRFTGDGPEHKALDEVPYPDFGDLRAAREAEDARIAEFADSLSEDGLTGTFTYTTIVMPQQVMQKLAPALAHFFNHQTHHRGQAHTILSLLGKSPPPLDLIYFQRSDEGRQWA